MSDPLAVISLHQDTPELARTYEQLGVIQFNHGKLLLEPLALKPGERVLDVGAGTGRLAEFAAHLVGPGGRVVGIDPLESRIAIARLRQSSNLVFDTGRAEDLSRFGEDEFDVIYLNSVLHWISDKRMVLQEARRALRPGGRIGLTIQDPTAPHESRLLLRRAIAAAGLDEGRLSAHGVYAATDDELRSLFEQAGFVGYQSELRTLIETHGNVDELLGWSESSAFGNFLDGFTYAEGRRIRAAFAELVEAHRTPEGLRLARYLRYAFARKPD
ncbi:MULTISPECIES: class I SAM-dependent methyltransferase [unclassified Bradyrhizobium]|uniref:class I SAM-dependent methyltransferase n=1 Tax=unclassified Bradyrhizobium TaxID=2631580 RepID=UPI0028E27349|nr:MULTISPECIES: methyltransferase domain-containing protein [unclassified Bradyrhizobium]